MLNIEFISIDVVFTESGSAVLQTALYILATIENHKILNKFVQHIVKHGFNAMINAENQQSHIHPLFEQNSTCKLMEVSKSVF